MPSCKINVYYNGKNEEHEFEIQSRVTITGKEDHFARAYEDAWMILIGMRKMLPEDSRVSIISVAMDRHC